MQSVVNVVILYLVLKKHGVWSATVQRYIHVILIRTVVIMEVVVVVVLLVQVVAVLVVVV